MNFGRVALVLLAALLTTGCPGAGGAVALATIVSSFADGTGDTVGAGGTIWDVTKVISRRIDSSPFGSYDTLQVEITFAQPVVLPPAGSGGDGTGTQTLFDLGFSTDLSDATGIVLGCGALGSWTGNDFFVFAQGTGGDANRLANGNYNVIDAAFLVTGQASVSVSGTVLTVNVPLSAMGADDGVTHLRVFVANDSPFQTTDCAPDPTGSVITTPGRQHGVIRR